VDAAKWRQRWRATCCEAAVPVEDTPAYCGPAPVPAELGDAWNLDPAVGAALVAITALYALRARRFPAVAGRQRFAFGAGVATLAVAFLSPLCALGVALFAARVGQHLLLILVAAPLLVLGTAPQLPTAKPGTTFLAGGAFAVTLWLWHAPAPYDATLRDPGLYWLMHLSLLGAACWLWHALLPARSGAPARGDLGPAVLGFATALQMGLLGALLALSPRPLYDSHLTSTAPWGLTPLADQALGGLLCWVPGCAVFAAAGLHALSPWLRPAEEPPAAAAAADHP
jgi:putative membrane protein